MALFGRDYGTDYDYPFRPSPGWTADRSRWARTGTPIADRWANRGYARDFGYGTPYYGADYGWSGYDRGYKSRWQTDYGDPFGDRERHTPMRVVRGEPFRRERGWEMGYDRDYGASPYPMGYRPYSARAGYDTGYGPRSYRTGNYGYRDTSWF